MTRDKNGTTSVFNMLFFGILRINLIFSIKKYTSAVNLNALSIEVKCNYFNKVGSYMG